MADGSSSQSAPLPDKKMETQFLKAVNLFDIGRVGEAANEFRKVGYSFKEPFKMQQF